MLLRVVKIYVAMLFLSVVLDACKCPDQEEYQRISSIEFKALYKPYGSNNAILVRQDTLFMEFKLLSECLAQAPAAPLSDFFISRAMATSFRCICGQKGFTNPFTDVKIITDGIYASYPAGADITPLVKAFLDYDKSNVSLPLDSIPAYLMEEYSAYNGKGSKRFDLFLTQKPGDSLLHTFTIKVTSSDSVRTATTTPLRWY